MEIIEHEQGSEGWLQARLGVITASNFSKVLAGGKGLTRKSYMLDLASQRLSSELPEPFTNAAMEWGTEHEPQARAMYELETGSKVAEVGLCKLSDNIGASPDGFVGDNGLIEIKCPNTSTHIETILSGKMPTKHNAQVQGQLWVTDREWCDFVSFDPRISNSLFCVRVIRDKDYILNLSEACNKFLDELLAIIERVGT
jgi:putative phage-type endonuclease